MNKNSIFVMNEMAIGTMGKSFLVFEHPTWYMGSKYVLVYQTCILPKYYKLKTHSGKICL